MLNQNRDRQISLNNQIRKKQIKLDKSWNFHIFIFIVACIIIVSRRPDTIFNAQFWAEDGTVFYADAYNLGATHSIFLPYRGYFSTFQRLIAAFSQLFPLIWAPLIFNITAIIVQAIPVNFILSSRFFTLIPSISTRLFLAFLYLALPNSSEIDANLTNSQWHLAILACIVILAEPSKHFAWCFFDIIVILVSALTGPYSILLFPIAGISWWLSRKRWLLITSVLIILGALVQVIAIALTPHGSRAPLKLGTILELLKILFGQVFLGSLIGQKGYTWIFSHLVYHQKLYILLTVLVAIAGIYALLYSLFKAPPKLRLFMIFAAFILIGGLLSPAQVQDSWSMFIYPGGPDRYWFASMLAFVIMLVWMLSQQNPQQLRVAAAIALAVVCFVGIPLDWRYKPFDDLHFKEYANQFEHLPKGSVLKIPINPSATSPPWYVDLTKH